MVYQMTVNMSKTICSFFFKGNVKKCRYEQLHCCNNSCVNSSVVQCTESFSALQSTSFSSMHCFRISNFKFDLVQNLASHVNNKMATKQCGITSGLIIILFDELAKLFSIRKKYEASMHLVQVLSWHC